MDLQTIRAGVDCFSGPLQAYNPREKSNRAFTGSATPRHYVFG